MNSTTTTQNGFTLIELMIVIAIIGVLSAVAIPTYKNHTKKSEATVAVSTSSALLTNIELHIQEQGTFPTQLTDIGASTDMSRLGTLTLTQDANNNEIGTVLFTFGANSALTGETVTYTKTLNAGWQCTQTAYDSLKSCPYVVMTP